ncbi:MAG: helix-turn-helix domain-containing protein [Clostridium sp.]|nr:helix-turn-helix domain-containing protein [Clostridium sp.]
MKDNLITTIELAKKLDVSTTTITRLCKGGLPCYKITDKKILFNYEEVLEYIRERQSMPKVQSTLNSNDYRDTLIVPLTGEDSLEWYNNGNSVLDGERIYILNEQAEKHINNIRYLAVITDKEIKRLDYIVDKKRVNLKNLGLTSNEERWSVVLDGYIILKDPIKVDRRSGPGYTLNCSDIIINNQGKHLKDLTAIRDKRMSKYHIV